MESYFVDKKSCKHHQVFPGVDMFTSPCEKMMLSLVEMAPHSIIAVAMRSTRTATITVPREIGRASCRQRV